MSDTNSKVLVIGASGFLGRHVVQALLADGHAVRGMARDVPRGGLDWRRLRNRQG